VIILDEVPASAPWTVLSVEADATIYYAAPQASPVQLGDTANYRDNLAEGEPRVWVALRRSGWRLRTRQLTKVTADPTEGEAIFESGCDGDRYRPDAARHRVVDRRLVDDSISSARFTSARRDRAGGDGSRYPEAFSR